MVCSANTLKVYTEYTFEKESLNSADNLRANGVCAMLIMVCVVYVKRRVCVRVITQ